MPFSAVPNSDIKRILSEKKQDILSIAEKHGASNIRVFGSVVRGEATQDSDIDFLIDYDIEKTTSWFPTGLIHDLEALLERKVDIVPADSIHYFIRDRILGEAVSL
ncbi:MAG: nucleotidyltransferase domain-containing protein [Cyanobacteria bacterium J06621_3]